MDCLVVSGLIGPETVFFISTGDWNMKILIVLGNSLRKQGGALADHSNYFLPKDSYCPQLCLTISLSFTFLFSSCFLFSVT